MINIIDNFLEDEHYTRLTGEHIEYGRVHWFGKTAKGPKNSLHELIMKSIGPQSVGARINAPLFHITGCTAWYNIRPIDPQWHNDIDSYCTAYGKTHYPKMLPETTMIYYIKTPEIGGELELETGDLIRPLQNRFVSFPCNLAHRVREYKGNRVSIGIIWWYDLPSIYGKELGQDDTAILDRVWEIEDAR